MLISVIALKLLLILLVRGPFRETFRARQFGKTYHSLTVNVESLRTYVFPVSSWSVRQTCLAVILESGFIRRWFRYKFIQKIFDLDDSQQSQRRRELPSQ